MTALEILELFPQRSALIVGDICLDRWCKYDPAMAELSEETRIPRVPVVSSEMTPGAGGSIASSLAALGIGRAAVLGVLGRDGYAYELTQALNARAISTDLLVRSEKVSTFTYTKFINAQTGLEDLSRVDFINTQPLPDDAEQEVLTHLADFAPSFDVIFVSDQADSKRGGVVTVAVRALLESMAGADPDKIIWVDSRIRIERFQKMILKPNEREASAASIALFGQVDYQRLRSHTRSKLIFVTKASEGVLIVEDGQQTLVPGRPIKQRNGFSGAGDSFSAAAGIALCITGSPIDAARFGNLVASISLAKRGVATFEEVLSAPQP